MPSIFLEQIQRIHDDSNNYRRKPKGKQMVKFIHLKKNIEDGGGYS